MNQPHSTAERLQIFFNAIVGAKPHPLPHSYLETPIWHSCIEEIQIPAVWRRRQIRQK